MRKFCSIGTINLLKYSFIPFFSFVIYFVRFIRREVNTITFELVLQYANTAMQRIAVEDDVSFFEDGAHCLLPTRCNVKRHGKGLAKVYSDVRYNRFARFIYRYESSVDRQNTLTEEEVGPTVGLPTP